jgi:protein-L-isoaspartate(D-aspartate) O-methyltransferase
MSERIYDQEAAGEDLRARLVEELRANGSIRTIGVAAAFAEVQRELFIPEVVAERGLEAVYRDEAYVTKRDAHGMPLSSSSQPAMMAQMLELLECSPGHRVLEIGAGTGYNAALLSKLVGPTGQVFTVDVDPEIAERAQRGLRAAGAAAPVAVADGRAGFALGAPYDRIMVTASAPEIPRAWLEQLADGGRLVVPLRLDPDADAIQLIPAFVRHGEILEAVETTWGGFMPLHDGDGSSQAPKASLNATLSSGGEHTLLVQLTGSGLERLSEGAARRALAALAGEARRPRAQGSTPLVSGHTPAVLIYLMVRIPDRKRIWIRHGSRHGVGLIEASGPGIAAVTVPSVWELTSAKARRARWRLESWGEQRALDRLERLVSDWLELQRAGRERLEITADPAGEALRLSFNWSEAPPHRAGARKRASA